MRLLTTYTLALVLGLVVLAGCGGGSGGPTTVAGDPGTIPDLPGGGAGTIPGGKSPCGEADDAFGRFVDVAGLVFGFVVA